MKPIKLHLICAIGFLSFMLVAISDLYALTNIPNATTLTAPPQADDAINFQAPAPGGIFIIESSTTFTGAITNDAASIGNLVLNSGSQLNGAVATGISPLLTITLNDNATIIGATSAETFNLGQYTLTNTGALNLPSNLVINTKIISNSLFGHIAASGANSLAGNVAVNVDASGIISLTTGAPLFIISADGTTSGRIIDVTSNNILYSFTGSNLNGNISIIPSFNPAIVLPGGVGSVFTALNDIAAQNPNSDIATVMSAVANLSSVEEINAALVQFNPITDGALPQVSFDAMKQFHNLWTRHLGYGRCVYANDCSEPYSNELSCDPKKYCDSSSTDPCCNPKQQGCCFTEFNCPCVPNRFEVWAEGFGYFGHQDARQNFQSYNSQIYGGMIGFQAPVNQVTSIGFGAGYADSTVRRKHVQDSNSSMQTYDATLYVSYDPTHWYVDGSFSFDWNQYKDSRHIEFTGINRTAKSSYSGQQYSAFVTTGYRYYTKFCGIITPLAGLQYSYLNVNKYHEHGAGDLNLHVDGQDYNFLESTLGLKLSRPIQTHKGAFVPEVHALWLHDFFGDRMELNTAFSGVAEQAGTFSTNGPSLDKDRGDVGASITFITCNRLGIQLSYNYVFSKTYHSNEGLIKISKRF